MNDGSEEKTAQPLLEPLTRREHEVLTLLAEGLTGGEIAERLTLAVSSVRWFAHQIYGKLGVNGRRQAVMRARELGLLRFGTSNTVTIPGVTSQAPSLEPSFTTAIVKTHNLPVQRTPLVGRAQEVQQVKELLAQGNLITLTGSGGVGKTRLSLQVAEMLLERFTDGVWYVDLAALTNPELVPLQVAQSLGVREVPAQPVTDSLISFLRNRQVLLVVDNCEHLLVACSLLVDALLNVCEHLKILASSREPLGVAGEVSYRVPSLPFPPPGQAFSPEDAVEFAAVRLFVIRARQVRPGFQVTVENAASLAHICQLLDGIPLAIELAAARTGVLSLDEVANRLDDAFRLLTGGSRSALPRQQTLRATIDWSYMLLNNEEKFLFQRLAVFAGGCTLEAAETVCSCGGLEAGDVLDLLSSLATKSMVSVDFQVDAEATRYHLLETVRQYAREKLLDSGENARLYTCHQDYFLAYIETNALKLYSRDWPIWRRKLEAEHDNLTQGLEWSFSSPSRIEAGLKFFLAMQGFWGRRNYLESYKWYKRAEALFQDHAQISLALWAEFLGAGSHWMAFNDPRAALNMSQQAVDISRQLGPDGTCNLIERLIDLVWNTIELDDYRQALVPFAEAETLLKQLDPEKETLVWVKMTIQGANLANQQGKFKAAIAYASESIQIAEKLGFIDQIWQLFYLGDAYTGLHEYDRARDYYQQALRQAVELGDLRKGTILNWLGLVDFLAGNLDRALGYCQQGLKEANAIPDYNVMAFCMDLAARIRAKQGLSEQAAHLSGAAHALYERQGRLSFEHSELNAILPDWEIRPGREAIRQAYEKGRGMSVEQAVDYALNRL